MGFSTLMKEQICIYFNLTNSLFATHAFFQYCARNTNICSCKSEM